MGLPYMGWVPNCVLMACATPQASRSRQQQPARLVRQLRPPLHQGLRHPAAAGVQHLLARGCPARAQHRFAREIQDRIYRGVLQFGQLGDAAHGITVHAAALVQMAHPQRELVALGQQHAAQRLP